MILDASAIVAIMRAEPEAAELSARLLAAARRETHGVSVYEATLAVARLSGDTVEAAEAIVMDFLEDLTILVSPIGPAETAAALDAFARYGKGRHPAALNMGDCFSYACARTRGMPLLYKGEDFAKTDLAPA